MHGSNICNTFDNFWVRRVHKAGPGFSHASTAKYCKPPEFKVHLKDDLPAMVLSQAGTMRAQRVASLLHRTHSITK
jgi:hypothetical protein